jgi:hypothetical protein
MAMRTLTKLPSGPAFISYAYQDEEALEQLKNILRAFSVTPFPFPPINVAPSEMVSNDLIDSIKDCRSLIYIDTRNSKDSRWVTLEREYARRSGKLVFSYKPETAQLELDERPPLDLPVFPSYTREDNEKVEWIIKFMREERFFDIFLEYQDLSGGDDWAKKIESAMYDRLKRGGYTVLFWSTNAAQSKWVQREVERSLTDFPKQVFVSLLEDVRPPIALMKRQAIGMFGKGPHGLDYRRIDDLIVYLYWFMQERGSIEVEA